jgi:NitT/TauT family transport system permease protein
VIILSSWEAAYRTIGWREYVFPAPSHVADALLNMAGIQTAFGDPVGPNWPRPKNVRPATTSFLRSDLLTANLVSGVRLLIGFAISILIGATLGLLMWRFREFDLLVGPLFLGFQTLPSVCWVPLGILLLGLSEKAILFVLVMGSCFAIAISMRDGLRTIPIIFQHAGRMMGARSWRLYRYVLLPASLPALATSLRQGFSFAWRSLMGAELILTAVNNHGLGFLLESGRNFSDVAQVVAVLIVMVVIGMIVDRWLFARLQLRVQRRFGLA